MYIIQATVTGRVPPTGRIGQFIRLHWHSGLFDGGHRQFAQHLLQMGENSNVYIRMRVLKTSKIKITSLGHYNVDAETFSKDKSEGSFLFF